MTTTITNAREPARRKEPSRTGFVTALIVSCALLGGAASTILGSAEARAEGATPMTHQAKADPGKTVTALAEEALAVLVDPALARQERNDAFRALLNEGFDLETIGTFVLGRYSRDASEAEREEFHELFEDFLIASYVSKLDTYNGEALEVVDWNSDEPGHALVSSRLRLPQGEPLKVQWRMREIDENWRIVDVVIEGVSLAVTMRSEFTSVIRSQGGMAALLDRLRKVIATAG